MLSCKKIESLDKLPALIILGLLVIVGMSSLQSDVDSPPTPLMTLLARIRNLSEQYPAPYILWTLFFSAVVATVTMMAVCPRRSIYDMDIVVP